MKKLITILVILSVLVGSTSAVFATDPPGARMITSFLK